MDYISPYGAAPGDPYVDDNEALEIDGSIPPAQFFNDAQAELLNVITGAGLVPSSADLTQLRQAIQNMIIAGGKTVKITGAVFEGTVADGNPVRWDAGAGEYVKALADGTAANRAVGFADVTNAEVIYFGLTRADLFAGLTPGAREYLSGAVAGAMVEVAPADAVRLGIALSATQMFVDVDTGQAVAQNPFPAGHLFGLTLSNNAVDANNDIDISAGACRDAADAANIVLAAGITKQLDTAWAEGTGAGGLFSGAKAISTWYHVHLIVKDADGTVDAGFDTSVTAANIPAGWTAYRRRAVRTDSSGNILAFHQHGDHFVLDTAVQDVSNSGSTVGALATLTVPLGVSVLVQLQVWGNGATGPEVYTKISSPAEANTAPSVTYFDVYTNSNAQTAQSERLVRSDTSSQVRYRQSDVSTNNFRINTMGWFDDRGRAF